MVLWACVVVYLQHEEACCNDVYVQDEHIYVTDPLALHHIIVKEQDIYEEPSMQIA